MHNPTVRQSHTAANIIISLLLALLLAGCGTGESEPDSSATVTTNITTATAPPVATFFAPTSVTVGQVFQVIADSVPGVPDPTHNWDIVAPAGSSPTITSNGLVAVIVIDVAGDFTITHTATDSDGLSSTASRTVIATPLLNVSSGSVVTTVEVRSLASVSEVHTNVPVTFGQVFAQGDLPEGFSLAARLQTGEERLMQVDAKTRYADGSLKHAVLTTVIPSLTGGEQIAAELVSVEEPAALPAVELSDLPANFDAIVTIDIGGDTYTASLRDGMALEAPSFWLQGHEVAETHYMAPFVDNNSNAHPLLTARFQLRVYNFGKVRTDVIVENANTFVTGASDLDYTVQISAGGTEVMSPEQIAHRHHSRWRKMFWTDDNPALHLNRDLDYLISTGSIPNYDHNITVLPSSLESLESKLETEIGQRSGIPRNAIMGAGVAEEYMPNVGGRQDLGLLPGWQAIYLYTMDERAARATFVTADAAAHWPIHYRDESTGLPVSLETYPNLTTHPNVFNSPSNPLPACIDCRTDLFPDTAHQPAMTFLPYMLSGDHYLLEELHFWTNRNTFRTAPGRRNFEQALFRLQQVRGQAWAMRSLLQTIYITPDDHPLKSYFQTQLDNNVAYYNSEYVDNPDSTPLGFIFGGSGPNSDHLVMAPWTDDFFTAALNYGRHMGFEQLTPLLEWKMQFALKRMSDPVFCWQFATIYHYVASEPGSGTDPSPSQLYETLAEAYIPTLQDQYPDNWQAISQAECGSAEMAAAAGLLGPDEFTGYPTSPTGYPAALQMALTATMEFEREGAQAAWDRLTSAPHRPSFERYPSFAILPRQSD